MGDRHIYLSLSPFSYSDFAHFREVLASRACACVTVVEFDTSTRIAADEFHVVCQKRAVLGRTRLEHENGSVVVAVAPIGLAQFERRGINAPHLCGRYKLFVDDSGHLVARYNIVTNSAAMERALLHNGVIGRTRILFVGFKRLVAAHDEVDLYAIYAVCPTYSVRQLHIIDVVTGIDGARYNDRVRCLVQTVQCAGLLEDCAQTGDFSIVRILYSQEAVLVAGRLRSGRGNVRAECDLFVVVVDGNNLNSGIGLKVL